MISPSLKLQEILESGGGDGTGVAYVERLSENPLIAVGFAPERKLGLVLLLPANVLQGDITLDRIECRRSMNLSINFGKGKSETIEAGTIFFDSVSPAVEIVLDALAQTVVADTIRAGNLAQDFIDLFRPGKALPEDELIGLFGELCLISQADDKDYAVSIWHEATEGRYDFTSGSSRLEVKTSLGDLRKHHFSSSQLPAKPGVSVRIASVITEIVQDGTSVVDLWRSILNDLSKPQTKDKFNHLVLKTVSKDPDKSQEIGFDFDSAIKSIEFFPSTSVPTPILTDGVISASWEALINQEFSVPGSNEDVNEGIRKIC